MTLPNFLVIGANKAGTTALYHCLRQHPEIYMSPIKEPMFFAFYGANIPMASAEDRMMLVEAVNTIEAYQALFEGARSGQAIGEASTAYLSTPDVPERIKRELPHVRLIAILRDPVERAFSNYLYFRAVGLEPCRSFRRALQLGPERGGFAPRYVGLSLYHAPLRRYYDTFARSQIRVYLYEEWNSRPFRVLRDMFGFLGVRESVHPDIARHNESIVPRSRSIDRVARQLERVAHTVTRLSGASPLDGLGQALRTWNRHRPRLAVGDRRALVSVFREDILRLQDLIDRDLSAWLRC